MFSADRKKATTSSPCMRRALCVATSGGHTTGGPCAKKVARGSRKRGSSAHERPKPLYITLQGGSATSRPTWPQSGVCGHSSDPLHPPGQRPTFQLKRWMLPTSPLRASWGSSPTTPWRAHAPSPRRAEQRHGEVAGRRARVSSNRTEFGRIKAKANRIGPNFGRSEPGLGQSGPKLSSPAQR